jgi:hypothetical protein
VTTSSLTAKSTSATSTVFSAPPLPTPAASQPTTATSGAAPTPAAAASAPAITADAMANGFATLVGALLGAMLAYWFQVRVLHAQEHKAALMSAHRTMFSLLQQINTIVLIQRDYVYPELKSLARHISIPATPPFDPAKNVLNISDLAFLLETGEGRFVLYEFYIAQENYVEAINHWNLRSNVHTQQVQPALAAAGLVGPGVPVTMEALEQAMGPLVFGTIVNATDDALIALRRAFEKLVASKDKVRAYAVKQFKSNDFLDFDFPETWGLTTENPE